MFLPPQTGFQWSGKTRQYFIKAEEVAWDYIPSKWDNMRGVPIAESPIDAETANYAKSNDSIGSKYIKSLYRGYTTSNFTTLLPQPDWIGFQGPLVQAEVGDMVEVRCFRSLLTLGLPSSAPVEISKPLYGFELI